MYGNSHHVCRRLVSHWPKVIISGFTCALLHTAISHSRHGCDSVPTLSDNCSRDPIHKIHTRTHARTHARTPTHTNIGSRVRCLSYFARIEGRFSQVLRFEAMASSFFSSFLGDSYLIEVVDDIRCLVEDIFFGTRYEFHFKGICQTINELRRFV